MNRDELAALGRGATTVLAGAAILVVIGLLISWWTAGAIALVGIADAAWCAQRLPARWRPW